MPKISKNALKFKKNISAVKEIMNFAEPKYIENLGINPNELISMAGGWVNHESPEELRRSYEKIISQKDQFHNSGKYSATLGEAKFKKAVCHFEKKLYNMDINEDEVIGGLGSTQLTMNLFYTLIDSGDKIVMLDPYYCNFPTQLITCVPDVKISTFSVIDEKDWKYLAEERIENFYNFIIKEKPQIILLTCPDNPTSKILSDNFLEKTLEAAKIVDAYLIVDFAYKELIFQDYFPKYFSWPPNNNFIAIRSNSKWCRGLGRRLGWIEAPKEVIDAMESIQNSTSLCPDTLHQMAFSDFIMNSLENNNLENYIKSTRKLYREVSEKTHLYLKKYLKFPIIAPDAGLYFFINVNFDGTKFVENALKYSGVLFVPGWGFGRTGKNAIRLSIGPLVNQENKIEEGIIRISETLDKIFKKEK